MKVSIPNTAALLKQDSLTLLQTKSEDMTASTSAAKSSGFSIDDLLTDLDRYKSILDPKVEAPAGESKFDSQHKWYTRETVINLSNSEIIQHTIEAITRINQPVKADCFAVLLRKKKVTPDQASSTCLEIMAQLKDSKPIDSLMIFTEIALGV